MSTLNARANQAWAEAVEDPAECNFAFEHQRAAFEEGWEIGYKAACAEQDNRLDKVEAGAYDVGWNDAKEDRKL